jgi:hypothetical protein
LRERPSRCPCQRREHRSLAVVAQSCAIEIRRKILLKIMVAGHGMRLVAFLAQPHPKAAVLHEPSWRARHRRARMNGPHEGNQGTVTQSGGCRRIDAVEQHTRLGWFQHRRLDGLHDVLRTAHGGSRVHRYDLADDKPIEQVADRGKVLLDGRHRHHTGILGCKIVIRCAVREVISTICDNQVITGSWNI